MPAKEEAEMEIAEYHAQIKKSLYGSFFFVLFCFYFYLHIHRIILSTLNGLPVRWRKKLGE